jgi:hypothetical protein
MSNSSSISISSTSNDALHLTACAFALGFSNSIYNIIQASLQLTSPRFGEGTFAAVVASEANVIFQCICTGVFFVLLIVCVVVMALAKMPSVGARILVGVHNAFVFALALSFYNSVRFILLVYAGLPELAVSSIVLVVCVIALVCMYAFTNADAGLAYRLVPKQPVAIELQVEEDEAASRL